MNETRSSAEIRDIFLRFFEEQDHLRIPGASIVPRNDPTLLYVNSGMAPLKPYFTGEETPPQPDLCNAQPCIRTRDIDDVGDRHHLTFFEMLGSWSIDNYFKERAIELAFELLVDRLGIPKERLYATVYQGDTALDLPTDEVSARAWESVGLRQDQIVFLGGDNFWGPAGDHGPCGPCTEVFYDTGDEFGPAYQPGSEFDTKHRYIEIWNAGVFMEFNKLPDGNFQKLRFTSVDTGSGLERMTMTLGGHQTVYETDLLRPLVDLAGEQLGANAEIADLRVLADHLRAATFMLAEGVTPSNEGRGYIPRRLIRKAVAITARADAKQFDFGAMISQVVASLGPHYPVLQANQQGVIDAFTSEKKDFERVINKGLERLEALCSKPPFKVSGSDVFTLFSTYGMPVELVRDIVAERGGEVDEAAFDSEFRQHQEISRAGPAGTEDDGGGHWPKKLDHIAAAAGDLAATDFVGYDDLESDGEVLALFRDGVAVERVGEGEWLDVVTDRTPFYAESGGQSADRGTISSAGGLSLQVSDTKSAGGVTVHRGQVADGAIAVGDGVRLEVDRNHRLGIMANHSATHLLHAGLREVLGDHVKQAGSLVEGDRLRFDFQHTAKMTDEELESVGRLVNRYIRENHDRTTEVTTLKAALKQGALAFFGENYGDEVRLVRFGDASSELCGGTHVGATGEIGLFRIVSEGSIASGIRRIVAITGESAHEQTVEHDRLLRQMAARLKVGVHDVLERVEKLLSADKKPAKDTSIDKLDAEGQAQTAASGVRFVASTLAGDVALVRDEAQRVASAISGVACVVADDDGKARIIVAVDRDGAPQCDARKLMAELAPIVGGRGGGKPQLAQGGGGDVGALGKVLAEFPGIIDRTCGESASGD